MTVAAAIAQLTHIKAFFLAGHAKFTLVSKVTGERKTFEVRRKEGEKFWFVSLLNGPDNTSDFRYLGCVFESRGQLLAKMNKENWGRESFSALLWLLGWFNGIGRMGFNETKFFQAAEFWHAGTCARCGRDLTDPESIARGLGPVCAERS